jgi:Uma2 family endonuclease
MATDSMTPAPTTAPLPFAPATPFLLPVDWTLADLQAHLGGIPLERIRLYPPPGTATKSEMEAIRARTDRTCELIDGVLVEKAVGHYESMLAILIGGRILAYLDTHDVGTIAGADSMMELFPGHVRAPDVCVTLWERYPGGSVPDDPIPPVVPNLVVEVLSRSNTRAEMRRKLHDYFTSGVQLVWYIDPRTRTARAHTAEEQFVEFDEKGSLSGGEVLPGFDLSLAEVFNLPKTRRG